MGWKCLMSFIQSKREIERGIQMKKATVGMLLVSLACLTGCQGGTESVSMEKNEHVSSFNYYDLPELPLEEELLETLIERENVRIERIVSTGQTTDGWYDQEEHEYVVLLAGTAQITYENGETVDLAPGDTLMIPAHEKHRVSYTSSEPACIWLCVFWS